MGLVALPEPDQAMVARRDAIVADLRRLVGADAVIADEDGRRAYETDALTAYRQLPLAVVLPALDGGGLARAALLPPARHQGGGAGRRHLPFGRRAAQRGRGRDRRLAHEPRARGRLRQPRRPCRGRRHQPRHQRGRQGARVLLRARPVESARLHDRRQHRHELGRRALPQVRRDHQQRARPEDGADGRRGDRDRRRASGFARLRPAWGWSSARRASSASPRRPPCASCARPRARARCCSASTPARRAGQCVSAIIGAGIVPVAIEFMDKPAIHVCEAFAKAGYPLDVEALLIVEVEGSDDGDRRSAGA